ELLPAGRVRRLVDMSTFVSIGQCYQPFSRLTDAVARLAAAQKLPKPVVVQHGYTPFSSPDCVPQPFLDRTEFDRYISQAELLIVRGGATVLQGVRAGRIPVVMPRLAGFGEHVNDHQLDFAESLASAGKVVVVREPQELESAVMRALALQAARGGQA